MVDSLDHQKTFPRLLFHSAAILGTIAAVGNFAGVADAKYDPDTTKFPKALGEHTLAMVTINFDGQPPLPFGNDVVRNQTFAATGSVADYYNKASFGQFTLRGEVFGPITLPPSLVNKECDEGSRIKLGAAASRAVKRQTGPGPSIFTNYGFTLPRTQATLGCDFGGMSQGNGFVNLETRAKYNLPPHKFYEGNVVHELAHSYGVSHANKIDCHDRKGRAVVYSVAKFMDRKCRELDYGDPIDPMGQGQLTTETPPDMSAINKARLGWLKPQNIQTIKHNGISVIAPLELQTDRPQLARVATGMTTNDKLRYFYMDVRQSIGLDSNIPPDSPLVNGVAIRESGPITDPAAEPLGNFTNFIDTTPKTPTAVDGTLGVGKTYKDSSTGISIKTLSIGPEGARIRVSGLKRKRRQAK
jgi:hypothetical protein